MDWFEAIANRRIDEAAARGDLRGLSGEGRPLDPARLRETTDDILHRLIGSEGFLPPEVQIAKDVEAKRAILAQIEDEGERTRLQKQIAMMELKRSMAADERRRGR